MCGLAGFIHHKKILSQDDLAKMVSTIDYRGPDDEGYYISGFKDFQVGMGFRRLAIIDLSAGGHQPMTFRNLVLTLNGEIYNFMEIRQELRSLGYVFDSSSDTEVAIKSFHCWGIKMVDRLIGMFAIALFDDETHDFYLIRDRMGIKPLYYYHRDNDLVYASELKPVMAYPGFEKDLNISSLSGYLYHGYITGPDSIFTDVHKLEPGTYLKYSEGKTEISKYWNLHELYTRNRSLLINSEEDCLQQLEELLASSVKYRMISDVPIGSFLSGGIDSSLITAIMQGLSDIPVNTFTIGFDDEKYNEAENARAVSKYLGTTHFELTLPIDKAKELILELPHFYDEPFGDSSAMPTMLVSRLAKKNATVVLSGDGGDELFCGYNNYESAKMMKGLMPLGKILSFIPGKDSIAGMLFRINPRFGRYPWLNNNINIINVNYILSKYYLSGIFLDREYTLNKKYFDPARLSDDLQELYMLNDMVTYLPDDILTKVDRASMAVSLEARVPILDHRIVEFSFRVPHKFKYRNGIQKHLLRELAYRHIPKPLLDRPKKGFAVPVFKWMKSDLHYLIEKYMSADYLVKQRIFNPLSVRKLLSHFENSDNPATTGNYIWNILMFQLWHEKYFR